MKTITLSLRTDESFYYSGRTHFRRTSRSRYFRYAIQIVAGVTLLVPCYVVGIVEHSWFALFFIAVLGVLVFSPKIDWLVARRRLRKSPYFGADVSITLHEGGFSAKEPKASTEISWTAFTRAKVFPDGLLLFQGEGMYNWLPRSAFDSDEDFLATLELVRQAVPKTENA